MKPGVTVIGPIAVVLTTAAVAQAFTPPVPSTETWLQTNALFTGDWQQYGQLFTSLGAGVFTRIFLVLLTLVPAVFLLHYILIGPKKFAHHGPGVYYFSLFVRLVHWLAALAFSLLVITGMLIVFGNITGGGQPLMVAREIHILSALLFTATILPMLLVWIKDMLPVPYDLKWMLIMGGYLSRKKKPVPAGKFNAGQKTWFWLATVGGAVMGISGYFLFSFAAPVDLLRQMAILHNLLAAVLTGMFLIHLYMSLFAVSGAVRSMISGYKSREEIDILHSRY